LTCVKSPKILLVEAIMRARLLDQVIFERAWTLPDKCGAPSADGRACRDATRCAEIMKDGGENRHFGSQDIRTISAPPAVGLC